MEANSGLLNNLGLTAAPAAAAPFVKSLPNASKPKSNSVGPTFRDELQAHKAPATLARVPLKNKFENSIDKKIKNESKGKVQDDREDLDDDQVDPREVSAFGAGTLHPIAHDSKLVGSDSNDAARADQSEASSSERRQDLQRFLTTMQDKLGVRPERIVKAFARLTERELERPPALSANEIVANLGLTDSQSRVAKQLLMSLIDSTGASDSKRKSLSDAAPFTALTAIPNDSLQALGLGNTEPVADLETPTSSFATDGSLAQPSLSEFTLENGSVKNESLSPNDPLATEEALGTGQTLAAKEAFGTKENLGSEVGPETKDVLASKRPQASSTSSSLSRSSPEGELDQLVAQMRPVSAAAVSAGKTARAPESVAPEAALLSTATEPSTIFTPGDQVGAMSSTVGLTPAQSFGFGADSNVERASDQAEDAPALSARSINEMLGALKAKSALDKNQNTQSGGKDSSDEEQNLADAAMVLPREGAIADLNAPNTTFESQLLKPNENGQPVTVPELMKNAQILIKDGGGEMKVTMHPEGLGEIAMKVSVERGKVDVTMLTQSDETKQIVERQLGDLRSSLAGTHLHAGEIKVGVMTESQANFDHQFERQADHHARDHQNRSHSQSGPWERGEARDQGQRRAFRSYGDESFGRTPSARAMAGQQALARSRQMEGARRLNLVA